MGSQAPAPARPDQHSLILSCILPHIQQSRAQHRTPHTTPHHTTQPCTTPHHTTTITRDYQPKCATTSDTNPNSEMPFSVAIKIPAAEFSGVSSSLCGCCETVRPCLARHHTGPSSYHSGRTVFSLQSSVATFNYNYMQPQPSLGMEQKPFKLVPFRFLLKLTRTEPPGQ